MVKSQDDQGDSSQIAGSRRPLPIPRIDQSAEPVVSPPPRAETPLTANLTTTPASQQHRSRDTRAFGGPPRRGDRIMDWLIMLLCVVLAAPPLFVDLRHPDAAIGDESRAVATSLETFGRLASLGQDVLSQLQPYLNEQLQPKQPPGITWAHLSILGLSPWPVSEAQIDQLVLLLRLGSVTMGLLTIAAVYWAGHSIGGRPTAAFAALVCAANPLFLWHARLATADIHFTGWALLAIAAALWAVRPLRPQPSFGRQFIGWVVAGLAMGLAILTHGLWAFPKVVLPLLLIIILCPDRMDHLLGLLAALLIGVLMALPWALYAHQADPQVWREMAEELLPRTWAWIAHPNGELRWRGCLIFTGFLPWTLWLLAALLLPFTASSTGARLRLLIGWLWFICAGTLFVVATPTAARPADLLPVLPAAAIVLGQQFSQYTSLAAEGRYPRLWRVLRWPHFVAFAAASVVLPAMLYLQPSFPTLDHFQPPYSEERGWWYWVGLALALVGLVMLSTRWALNHYPGKALASWAIWTLVLLGTLAIPVSRGPFMRNPIGKELGVALLKEDDRPVYWLTPGQPDDEPVHPSLLLFIRRPIPMIGQDRIDQLLDEHGQLYLFRPESKLADQPTGQRVTAVPTIGRHLWLYSSSPAGNTE